MRTAVFDGVEVTTDNEKDCKNYFSIKNLLKSQGGEEFKISFDYTYTNFYSCIKDSYLNDVTTVDAVVQVGDLVGETYIDPQTRIKYTVYKNSLISISTGNGDNDTISFGNLVIKDTTSAISGDDAPYIVSRVVLTDDPEYCSVEDFVKLFETFYANRYVYGSDFALFLFNKMGIKKKNSSFICINLKMDKIYFGSTYGGFYVKTEMSQINRYYNIGEVSHYNLRDSDNCYVKFSI